LDESSRDKSRLRLARNRRHHTVELKLPARGFKELGDRREDRLHRDPFVEVSFCEHHGPVRPTLVPFSGERERERSDRPVRPTATAVWVLRSAFLVISVPPRRSKRDMHPRTTNMQRRSWDDPQLGFASAGVPLPVTNTQGQPL